MDCFVDRVNGEDDGGLHDASARKIRNSYHSWRHFHSRNGHTFRSFCASIGRHYCALRDHVTHPLASLVDICRAGARCSVGIVFPKSSLMTGCALFRVLFPSTKKDRTGLAQRGLRIPRTG